MPNVMMPMTNSVVFHLLPATWTSISGRSGDTPILPGLPAMKRIANNIILITR